MADISDLNMEYDDDLTAMNGTLISIQKRTGNLKSFTTDDNYKIKTQNVIEALKKSITSRGIPIGNVIEDHHDQRLRRIHLFLLLNSDVSIQDKLMENVSFGHLVGCAPILSKPLLLELIWGLSMQQYLCEVITYSFPELSIELLNAVICKIKNLDYEAIHLNVEQFAAAVYIKFLNLYKKLDTLHPNDDIRQFLAKLFIIFKILLSYFMETCTSKVEELNKDMALTIQYAANFIKHLAILVNKCLLYNLNDGSFDNHRKLFEMYNPLFPYTIHTACPMQGKVSSVTIEQLNHELLQIFQANIQDITLDMWVSWVEYDSIDNPGESLQSHLAMILYPCMNTLTLVQESGVEASLCAELVSELSTMAKKPRDEDDEIREASVDDVVRNVADPEKSQHKWFKSLLNVDGLFTHKICFDCLENYLHLATYEDVVHIFDLVVAELISETKEECQDKLKQLIFTLIKPLSMKNQQEFMEAFVVKCGLCNLLLAKDFTIEMTETLNKIVRMETTHDELLPTLVSLFIQSPRTMVREVLMIALANGKQTQVMVNTLCHASSICNVALPGPCPPTSGNWTLLLDVINAIGGRDEWKRQEVTNCVHIITSLMDSCLLDYHIFITQCLLPALQTCLRGQNWDLAKMWLEILKVLIRRKVDDEHHLNLPVILLMLAQILELVSYSITTFQAAFVFVREETLGVVDATLHRFLKMKSTQDKEVKWLQMNITKTLQPRNQCYFNKLWSHFGLSQPLPSDKLLVLFYQSHCGIHWEANDITTSFIMVYLVKVLPSCTSNEWMLGVLYIKDYLQRNSIGQPDLYMTLFLHSICILFNVYHDTEAFAIVASLDYCFRNVVLLLKDLMMPELEVMDYEVTVTVFNSLTYIYDLLPEQIQSSCLALFCEVLQRLEKLVVSLASNTGKINETSVAGVRCDAARYLAVFHLNKDSQSVANRHALPEVKGNDD